MARSKSPSVRAPREPEAFYVECLRLLEGSEIPYLLAGTYAVNAHTGLDRVSKDLDIFCKAGDYPRILTHFQRSGYETEVEDERWIAKIKRECWFADVIFSSTNAVAPVTERWFEEICTARLYDVEVRVLPPTELVWSKLFVQVRRCRYRPCHSEAGRADRLEAAARLCRAILGGAARTPDQLSLHLSERAQLHPPMADQ